MDLYHETKFLNTVQVLESPLQIALDKHNSRLPQRQTQRNPLIPASHMEQHFGNIDRFATGTHFNAFVNVAFQLSCGHVFAGVGFMRLGVCFAMSFEIGLDTGWLDDTEVDWRRSIQSAHNICFDMNNIFVQDQKIMTYYSNLDASPEQPTQSTLPQQTC